MITNFERYTEEIFLAERRRIKLFWPNRDINSSYEWPILEQFRGSAALLVLAWADHQSWGTFPILIDLPANNTTQNQPKPTKRHMQTSWFQTNFAIYLWQWHCIYTSLLFQEISLPGRLTTAMTPQGLRVLLGSETWKYLWKLFVQWSKSLPDAASNYEFIPKWWDAIRAAFRFLSSIIVEKGLVQT